MLFHLMPQLKTTVDDSEQQGSNGDGFVLLPPAKLYFLIWLRRHCFGRQDTKLQRLLIKAFAYNSNRGIISERELGIRQAQCINFICSWRSNILVFILRIISSNVFCCVCALPACKSVWRKEGKNQIGIKIYTVIKPAPALSLNEGKGRQGFYLFLYHFLGYAGNSFLVTCICGIS